MTDEQEVLEEYNKLLGEMIESFGKRGIPLLSHFKSEVATAALITGASIEDCVSELEDRFRAELYYRGIF